MYRQRIPEETADDLCDVELDHTVLDTTPKLKQMINCILQKLNLFFKRY